MHCAAAEVGQGVTDVILQVARTELETDDVVVAPRGTVGVDSAGSASASRMTWMAAGAVQLAAGRRSRSASDRGRSTSSASTVTRARARSIRRRGRRPAIGSHVAFACAAMRVVAEVDVELGLTRVVDRTAQDVGAAVNPITSKARSRAARHRASVSR